MFVQNSCYRRSSLGDKCLFKKYHCEANGKCVLLSCNFLGIEYIGGFTYHLKQTLFP